jgi:hypothetical protein
VVTDPSIIQAVKNRARLQDAAKKRRTLEIGAGMPNVSDTDESMPDLFGGPPTMQRSRITQAFEAAADPRADLSLRPEYDPYTFREDVSRSIPFASEAAAGVAAAGPYLSGKQGFGEAYNRQKLLGRAEEERYARQHPGAHLGATALGVAAAGPTGAARAFGVRGAPAAAVIPATVAGRALEGIRGGAPIGALYGAGEGEGLKERAINAATGAAVGAGVGAALPYLGAAARSTRRLRNAYDPEIGGHVQRLDQEADKFYTQMDQQGVQLSRPTFNRILTNIQVRARNANIDPDLHKGPTAAVRALQRDIQDLSRAPTLRRMDQIRRKIRDAPTDSADDRRILRTMVEGLDENLNRLTPRDLVGGDVKTGMAALKEGRRLKKQYFKAETVDNLIENAKDKLGANYTQAGLQTGIRQEFRALNKKIRKDKMEKARWSNEERRLIQLIVRGGAGENFMRLVGRLAVRGPVSASIPALAGYFVNPALGAGMAAAGELTKRASTARGIMNAEALDRLIGTGTAKAPLRQLGPVAQGFGQGRRLLTELAPGLGDRLLRGEQ